MVVLLSVSMSNGVSRCVRRSCMEYARACGRVQTLARAVHRVDSCNCAAVCDVSCGVWKGGLCEATTG